MKSLEELSALCGVPVFKAFAEFRQSDLASSTDGVVIASSHASHHGIAMDAMEAGLNILVEKPMTVDVRTIPEKKNMYSCKK